MMHGRIKAALLGFALVAALPAWSAQGLTGKAFDDALRAGMAEISTEDLVSEARDYLDVGLDMQFDAMYGLSQTLNRQLNQRGVTAEQRQCILVFAREVRKLEFRS